LLEGIAALAGYDEAGGGKGYRPVDYSQALEAMGGRLAKALRASWLPKITNGWFFRAESFFSVVRYLDAAALNADAAPPDFLSHSHGEGFLRFFSRSAAAVRASSFSTNRNPRCRRRGRWNF
jgi:predicted ATPase